MHYIKPDMEIRAAIMLNDFFDQSHKAIGPTKKNTGNTSHKILCCCWRQGPSDSYEVSAASCCVLERNWKAKTKGYFSVGQLKV